MSVFKWANNGLVVSLFAFSVFMLSGCSNDDGGDKNPPVISNVSHADNEKIIGSRTVSFSADVTDDIGATVTITHNGNPVTVTASGDTYTASITLEDRTNNTIVVSASDADNTTTETVTLNYPFLAFSDGQAASVVIGQPDFDSFDANQGGSVGANTLDAPYDVKVINNRLYIADRDNHRVLGFNSIPTTDNASADFVIGQDSFTTNSSGVANNQLFSPRAINASDTQLFISHGNAGRINVWPDIPVSNTNASHVIGETGFVTGTTLDCNATSGSVFSAIAYASGKIIAPDIRNSRILIWNAVPATSGISPDIYLGQPNSTSCSANAGGAMPSANSFNLPIGVWTDGTRLVVGDRSNNRVLIWNAFPTTNTTPADIVLGQADFVTGDVASATNATELTQLGGVYSNGNQLFVIDLERIMIWNSWPTSNEQAADRVLGNPDFTGSTGSLGNDAVFSSPNLLSIHDNKLFVGDTDNHRVLIFEAP